VTLTDHHFWGGFRPTLHLAQFCRDFGRGMSMHSNSHIGISLAAMTHIAAAVPNLTYACDTHYPWQREDILVEPLRFENGAVRVPDGPGLGIEIDRDKLETLHQQYIAAGLTERNDEIEMQKVNPDWTFQALRW
jgi:glucarate dehydratase